MFLTRLQGRPVRVGLRGVVLVHALGLSSRRNLSPAHGSLVTKAVGLSWYTQIHLLGRSDIKNINEAIVICIERKHSP